MRISDWSSDVCSSDLRVGEGQGTVADIDVVERIAHPCGLDLAALDAGVADRFLECLDHQIVGAAVPAFAEDRTAHADDRDSVLDTRRHRSGLHLRPLCGHAFPEIRSEEHTSELQSLMRISYAVFCLNKKKHKIKT